MEARIVALQRQSLQQNAVRHSFSSAIASRFFVDGSLARRQRLMESAQRRQGRLRDKARAEQLKVEWLRRTFEEKKELENKKRGRDLDRSRRRVQNECATRIQRTWRQSYHERLYWRLVNHAAALIQVAMRDYMFQQHARRFQSTVALQGWWRLVTFRRQRRAAQHRIAECIFRNVLLRRGRRFLVESAAALIVQRAWATYWMAIKVAAATTIQRCARVRQRKRQIKRLASIHQHLRLIERMDASARVLQRNLACRAVKARLVQDARFQQLLRKTKAPQAPSTVADHMPHEGIGKAAAEEAKLLRQKDALLREIDELRRTRVPKATQRRNDERESLRRLKVLETQRAAKEKERDAERLREVEDQTKREIRWEMEKQFDHQRRLKMKQSKQHRDVATSLPGPGGARFAQVDSRIEIE